ncbi:hypothetical protein Zmor_026558 [Zophobas morio]|uniref:Uncharacterized protein n=1 Tax=Zophobas morio TaxID=2755281 RepID=A0AA38HZI0_9CUCU|nr:hypothetical protein Zmor_026558 [Zophobas morio]
MWFCNVARRAGPGWRPLGPRRAGLGFVEARGKKSVRRRAATPSDERVRRLCLACGSPGSPRRRGELSLSRVELASRAHFGGLNGRQLGQLVKCGEVGLRAQCSVEFRGAWTSSPSL